MSKRKTDEPSWEDFKKEVPKCGFNGLFYFEICQEAYKKLKSLIKGDINLFDLPPQIFNVISQPEFRIISEQAYVQECIIITFSAMCLEACIWDYAACGRSKGYIDDHLKNLSLVSKWVVIPELLSGFDIRNISEHGKSLIGRLKKLQKERHALVHSKSQHIAPESSDKWLNLLIRDKFIEAENSFHLIGSLLSELEKVDKTNWWFFKSEVYKNIIKKSIKTTKTN